VRPDFVLRTYQTSRSHKPERFDRRWRTELPQQNTNKPLRGEESFMKSGITIKIFALCVVLLCVLLSIRLLPTLKATRPATAGKPLLSTDTPKGTLFETNLEAAFARLEVRGPDIRTRMISGGARRIDIRIPRGQTREWVVWLISRCADATPYQSTDCVVDPEKNSCTMTFKTTNDSQPETIITITEGDRFFSTTATMAFLIENFNFQADQTTMEILSFPDPLTISLNPHEKKSAWTAQAAEEYKKEIIIQLPLEPQNKVDSASAASMIFVHFPEEKIRRMFDDAVKIIPNFAGINNYLGSRVCEDSRVMAIIMDEIAGRHGYFIETPVTRNSVAAAAAKKNRVPFASITTTIGDQADAGAIEDDLRHYCLVAQKKGSLIVSVKARPAFIVALKKVRELFAQNGIRLVYVSEIVSREGEK
jgi:polysaccharide deacetylase 2 family uncharacterized protein YibQ